MRPNNRPAGNILSEEYVGGQVILSGHETPGEGEHKIMDFIRYEKAQPGYDPNTRWAFCGLHRSSLFFILFF
jgi:5'-3' exonuclease